jgi:hypothetical protein
MGDTKEKGDDMSNKVEAVKTIQRILDLISDPKFVERTTEDLPTPEAKLLILEAESLLDELDKFHQ